jgi:hypothetical protein
MEHCSCSVRAGMQDFMRKMVKMTIYIITVPKVLGKMIDSPKAK